MPVVPLRIDKPEGGDGDTEYFTDISNKGGLVEKIQVYYAEETFGGFTLYLQECQADVDGVEHWLEAAFWYEDGTFRWFPTNLTATSDSGEIGASEAHIPLRSPNGWRIMMKDTVNQAFVLDLWVTLDQG